MWWSSCSTIEVESDQVRRKTSSAPCGEMDLAIGITTVWSAWADLNQEDNVLDAGMKVLQTQFGDRMSNRDGSSSLIHSLHYADYQPISGGERHLLLPELCGGQRC